MGAALKPLLKRLAVGSPAALPTLDLDFLAQTYRVSDGAGGMSSVAFADLITHTRPSTALRFNASGLLEVVPANQPRFDYDPVTLALRGLLIEEQRTNLLTYSSQFDNAAWVRDQIQTVAADARQAPDGTTSADKIVEGTASGTHGIYRASVGAAGAHAFYVFMHAAERSWGVVRIEGVSTFFNLASGVVGQNGAGNTASIKPVGDGWYCCCVVRTLTAAAAATIRIATADGLENYTGDGLSGIYIWGAQVEAGSFPTSYIPTTSTQVTRAADVASVNTLSPWFNPDEGTLFAEFSRSGLRPPSQGSGFFELSGSPPADQLIALQSGVSTPAQQRMLVRAAAVDQALLQTASSAVPGVTYKLAGAYRVNDFAACQSGGTVLTDASGVLPSGINLARLGVNLNGYLRRVRYWPRRLFDNELQRITA